MRDWTRILCLLVLLPACADSCSCGSGHGAENDDRQSGTGTRVAGAGAGASASAAAGASGHEPPLPPELLALRNSLEPIPDQADRAELEKAAREIDTASSLGEPLPGTRFASALPDRVGDYRAEGPAQAGVTPAEAGTATIAARRYRSGQSLMNVKITDTAASPTLRRELAEQLPMIGNAPTGHQRGRLEDGVPGLLAYHEKARASRAMALVSGRFLVEVMVEQASEQDAAWSAIEALDRKSLRR
jgi:hypothetical protein